MAQSDDGNSGRGGWDKNQKPAYVLRPPPLPGMRPPPVPPGTSQNVAAIKAKLSAQQEQGASSEQKPEQTSGRQSKFIDRDRADMERTRAALKTSAERLKGAERQNQVSRFVKAENAPARSGQAQPSKSKDQHPAQSRFFNPANDRKSIDDRRTQLKAASEQQKQSRFQTPPSQGRGDEPQR
ncbi:MAG: hypothetical protein ACTS1Z_12105 [Parasphingopyxis sp.]|uniref:hypothetical protein n=1 Tax=Parasphingopyxis sp. TaxID=1920299 RepID=UPI003FA0B7EE